MAEMKLGGIPDKVKKTEENLLWFMQNVLRFEMAQSPGDCEC